MWVCINLQVILCYGDEDWLGSPFNLNFKSWIIANQFKNAAGMWFVENKATGRQLGSDGRIIKGVNGTDLYKYNWDILDFPGPLPVGDPNLANTTTCCFT